MVEGAYVARPALRGYYDLIAVVEAPGELSLARQLARGENEPEQIARWRAAEAWYLRAPEPEARCRSRDRRLLKGVTLAAR